jgi:hypothetical protein
MQRPPSIEPSARFEKVSKSNGREELAHHYDQAKSGPTTRDSVRVLEPLKGQRGERVRKGNESSNDTGRTRSR